MRTSLRSCVARLAIAALALLGAPAHAQSAPQPIVFSHGLISGGGSFVNMGERYSQIFNMQYISPSQSWWAPFFTQGSELANSISSAGYPDTLILIGHSNGVPVERATTFYHGAKGMLMLGGVTQGAPILDNILNGFYSAWFGYAHDVNFGVADYYADRGCSWCFDFIGENAIAEARALGYWDSAMEYGARYNGWIGPYDVFGDMPVGSQFMQNINSPANLAREAATVPVRVGVEVSLPTTLGLQWNGFFPDYWEELTALQYSSISWDFVAFWWYSFYPDWYMGVDWYYWDKVDNAWQWLYAGVVGLYLDPMWCAIIGAYGPSGCELNDGILPVWAQTYPNGTNYFTFGPPHREQVNDPTVDNLMINSLTYDFGVQRR